MEASDLIGTLKAYGIPMAPEGEFDLATNRPLGPPEHHHDWGYDRSICAVCDAQHYFCLICGETEACF
jgi:hypothetical protein